MSQSALSRAGSLVGCLPVPRSLSTAAMKFIIFFLLVVEAIHAKPVEIYLASGQSNAKAPWASAIRTRLEAARIGVDVRVVNSARLGTPMWKWSSAGTRGELYLADLALVRGQMEAVESEGNTPVFSGVFWIQGESDACIPSTIHLYRSRFLDMMEFYRQDLGLSAPPKHAVGIIDGNPAAIYDDPSRLGTTREAVEQMRSVLKELGSMSDCVAVDSRPFTRYDAWHIEDAESSRLGTLMADSFLITLSGEGDYAAWASTHGIKGEQALGEADPDGDSVPNFIEYLVAGSPVSGADLSLLPQAKVVGEHYVFEFRRSVRSSEAEVVVEHSSDAETWVTAQDGEDGVLVDVTEDAFEGVDLFRVMLPLSGSGRRYARLRVSVP
jgi:hypothetical protein